jgi:tripartite-type tricarboxylate transporter receptor subunit TctC
MLRALLKYLVCVAALSFCAVPVAASAQTYPSRAITVVVPFPAGGPSDVVARIVTDHILDADPRRWSPGYRESSIEPSFKEAAQA